jgi:hypothetical protein
MSMAVLVVCPLTEDGPWIDKSSADVVPLRPLDAPDADAFPDGVVPLCVGTADGVEVLVGVRSA